MKLENNILHELISIQAGSINTLFSYNAETLDGSLLWVSRKMRQYLSQGLVRKIPFNVKPQFPRRQELYQLTKKGAKLIGRPDEYREKDHQSYNQINHELAKYDIALAFRRLFPDYNIDIEYEKLFKTKDKGIKCDIFIRANKKDGTKAYTFIIEIENKDDPNQTYRDKVSVYDRVIKNDFFRLNNLSNKTKILIVYNHSHVYTFLRPTEYQLPENIKPLYLSLTQFNNLLGMVKNLDDTNFRFLPFQDFYSLDQKKWEMPSGIKVKIIE